MKILPVLDLLQGQVVRGIAGERHRYQPIVSQLSQGSDPLGIAEAIRTRFAFDELYLADLDAIAGRPPALPLFRQLTREGFRLWIDAGLRVARDTDPFREFETSSLIIGLETIAGLAELREVMRRFSAERVVFSLDLKNGEMLLGCEDWPVAGAWELANLVVAEGIRRMIVLDLASVGMGTGVPTIPFCQRLRKAIPNLEITTGGGVRGPEDVSAMGEAGVDFALIASALHDGRFHPDDFV